MTTKKPAAKTAAHTPDDYRTVMNQNCKCQFISSGINKDGVPVDQDILFCDLHAAAPDLLAAAKLLVACLDDRYAGSGVEITGIGAMRAAIAKAEGR